MLTLSESAIPLRGPRLDANPLWDPDTPLDRSKPQYDSKYILLGYFQNCTIHYGGLGTCKVSFSVRKFHMFLAYLYLCCR